MYKYLLSTLLIIIFACFLFLAPHILPPAEAGPCSYTFPSTVAAGSTFNVSVTGDPGHPMAVRLRDSALNIIGSVGGNTDSSGNITVAITAPTTNSGAPYTFRVGDISSVTGLVICTSANPGGSEVLTVTTTAPTACDADVNKDGIVNSLDQNLILSAFGALPGTPLWNPDYDLDRDGGIDLSDALVALSFNGQTCAANLPPPSPTPTPCTFRLFTTTITAGSSAFVVMDIDTGDAGQFLGKIMQGATVITSGTRNGIGTLNISAPATVGTYTITVEDADGTVGGSTSPFACTPSFGGSTVLTVTPAIVPCSYTAPASVASGGQVIVSIISGPTGASEQYSASITPHLPRISAIRFDLGPITLTAPTVTTTTTFTISASHTSPGTAYPCGLNSVLTVTAAPAGFPFTLGDPPTISGTTATFTITAAAGGGAGVGSVLFLKDLGTSVPIPTGATSISWAGAAGAHQAVISAFGVDVSNTVSFTLVSAGFPFTLGPASVSGTTATFSITPNSGVGSILFIKDLGTSIPIPPNVGSIQWTGAAGAHQAVISAFGVDVSNTVSFTLVSAGFPFTLGDPPTISGTTATFSISPAAGVGSILFLKDLSTSIPIPTGATSIAWTGAAGAHQAVISAFGVDVSNTVSFSLGSGSGSTPGSLCPSYSTTGGFKISDFFKPAIHFCNFGVLSSDILTILISAAGALSFVFIVIGGIKLVTSSGDPKAIASARGTLTYAIIGLAVTILAFVIVQVVQYFLKAKVI